MDEWSLATDKGYKTDRLRPDFQKAFESVQHRRFLHQLQSFGIAGNLLKWFKTSHK